MILMYCKFPVKNELTKKEFLAKCFLLVEGMGVRRCPIYV